MQRMLSTALVLAVLVPLTVLVAAPAAAACHRFTVSVDPAEVIEGDTVTVTVLRDAAVGPSSVDVVTVDQTAIAGVDYEPLSETADFPDGGTSQTFTVATIDVEEERGRRAFRVELRNAQGCEPNPNLVVGAPARVTILDQPGDEPDEPGDEPEEPGEEPTEESVETDPAEEPGDPTEGPTGDSADPATERAVSDEDAATEGPTDEPTEPADQPTELTNVAILVLDDDVVAARPGTPWLAAGVLLALGLVGLGAWLWFGRDASTDAAGPV